MRHWLATLLAVLAFAASAAFAQDWPPLPTKGFISGHAATDKDVAEGSAIFVLKAYGTTFGKPLDIPIPQYGYLTKKGEKPVPVVVIQAEEGKGRKLFGVRDGTGEESVVREGELQLLGTKPPD